MNPADPKDPWFRLADAARRADGDGREESAPYGFATRVTALALTLPAAPSSLFERFALRAVGVASLLALLSAAFNYSAFETALARGGAIVSFEDALPSDDAMAVVLEATELR